MFDPSQSQCVKKPKKEANRIKKTVKFATTPSPPAEAEATAAAAPFLTHETGTNTMGVDEDEDDYEGAEIFSCVVHVTIVV